MRQDLVISDVFSFREEKNINELKEKGNKGSRIVTPDVMKILNILAWFNCLPSRAGQHVRTDG